ncbi:MAG: Hsp20/alpha crystallin family protein [Promethearchaeota archaeon]|nr:MAG: Hsp20/alpha crystallin family protein [Candidatus Lokiarchaeota archaeon]
MPSDASLRKLRQFMLEYIKLHPELSTDVTNIKISYHYDSSPDQPKILLNGHPMKPEDMQNLFDILHDFDPTLLENLPPSPILVKPPQSDELFVDIFDDGDFLTVIIEIPSVAKDQIELYNLSPTQIELTAGEIRQTILLPTSIEENSIKARFNNGILEITLEKQSELSQSRRISVD